MKTDTIVVVYFYCDEANISETLMILKKST
jgi:hypothetical protein